MLAQSGDPVASGQQVQGLGSVDGLLVGVPVGAVVLDRQWPAVRGHGRDVDQPSRPPLECDVTDRLAGGRLAEQFLGRGVMV